MSAPKSERAVHIVDWRDSRQIAAGVDRLTRVILALPELGMRVRWVGDYLSQPPEQCAAALNGLCEGALRGEPRAREALLAVALYLVGLNGRAPPNRGRSITDFSNRTEPLGRRALRELAEREALWALERLLRLAPSTDQSPSTAPSSGQPGQTRAEPAVPDYLAGRELTVGERRSLARRPSRSQLDRLLRDPHPLVLSQLLACPQITEAHVLRMVSQRPVRHTALDAVCQSIRWLERPRIRFALILQPSCPTSVSIPLLHTCVRTELKSVAYDPALPPVLRAVARELLERSPPLREPAAPLQ